MIHDSKATQLRNNFQLHKILLGVIKKLMMTENEVIYFSLYLDKLGWSGPEYHLNDYLSYVGFTVKIYLNASISIISDYLKQIDPSFEQRYLSFMEKQKGSWESINISPREVNKRHQELVRLCNSYCKQNYLDLNFIVDEVLAMSLPYSEAKRDKIGFDELSSNSNLIGNKRAKSVAASSFAAEKDKSINNEIVSKGHRILIDANPFLSKEPVLDTSNFSTFRANITNLALINTNSDHSLDKKKINEKENIQTKKVVSITKEANKSKPITLTPNSSFKPTEIISSYSPNTYQGSFLTSITNMGGSINGPSNSSQHQMISNLIQTSFESLSNIQPEAEPKFHSINLETENSGLLNNSKYFNVNLIRNNIQYTYPI